ncbi:MAG: acetate/propionate family kinase [Oscillospiraceae bacterium]|nr:acetate/propionate family kinase [Oscillospiraceae bacterium]
MKILAVNAGSTSVKLSLFDMPVGAAIAQCNCQRVGLGGGNISYKAGAEKSVIEYDMPDHGAALRKVISLFCEGAGAVISDIAQIGAVTHRISMGGPDLRGTVFASDSVLDTAEKYAAIAPLHNPPQVSAIRACRKLFGEGVPMTVGFDTAFHATMPPESFRYPIPKEYLDNYQVRRYGFHGLSYQFVTERFAALTGCDFSDHRMVVCHLGGGASVTAVKNGRSAANSFGFGTGQGLPCATRCGDIDTTAVGYIMERTGMDFHQVLEILHKKSGLLGLSGISGDEKELEEAAEKGDADAMFALSYFTRQIKKYIGAYAFDMGGLDALVFTGGIGENSELIREMSCDGLESFGIKLDCEKNRSMNRKEARVSTTGSVVDIWIIPTNEELVLAQDTYKLLGNS